MSQDKATRETIANQLSKEFGIAYSIAYKKIDNILNSKKESFYESTMLIHLNMIIVSEEIATNEAVL